MWKYNETVNPNDIIHYGVLGMKWGHRRYQNKDGSLTNAGKKRYRATRPDKVRREMQKAVNKARGQRYGKSNRWMSSYGIGKKSDEVHAKKKQANELWENSDVYKKAVKDTQRLDRLYNSGQISVDDYDVGYAKAWEKAIKTRPASNSYTITEKGRNYVNNYVQTIGKQLTIAYLEDLGFDNKSSKYIESIIRKSKKRTLD